ncbi:MAG: TlpA family protein disulfide reductase [Thermoanaerobaculia bacterium]|nr:TlpA family protein disulfide reductase [Thermoanaerobaculia bacterium]
MPHSTIQRLICLALFLSLLLPLSAPAQSEADAEDTSLPGFDVWDEFNQPISASSWLGGTPFLVDFWATWCGPCRFTLPELETIQNEYEGRLAVYGVSVDSGMGGGFRARNFAKEGGVTYPIFHDLRGQARKATGVNVLPVLFLYDGEGRLVADWWGEPDFDEVREAIDGIVDPVEDSPTDASVEETN